MSEQAPANFADIYLQAMRDRGMQSGTELACEIQLTDWSTAGNLSNRSTGVQIPRDICTRFGRYLYSTQCSWIINSNIVQLFVQQQTYLLYRSAFTNKTVKLFLFIDECIDYHQLDNKPLARLSILLDLLACSITLHLYSLLVF